MAIDGGLNSGARDKAVRWLLSQSGEETRFFNQLRMRLLGLSRNQDQGKGWPWFPETAAWVCPTALTIVALEKAGIAAARSRIASARAFLWSRMCRDGGWNHGSTRALGYEADSYPETTGIALLALRGEASTSPKLPLALKAAERHFAACRSSSAASWLQLALIAHGRKPAAPDLDLPRRGVMDVALWLLADRAASGIGPLLGEP
jgi:hypothetical protein